MLAKTRDLDCDLDLELTWLSKRFCIPSHWDEYLSTVSWKPFERLRRYKQTRNRQESVIENSWPSIVTWTLSRHGRVMGSTHHLTKVNIWPKLNESPLKGSGVTEHTRKGYRKLVTSDCDLDLEPTDELWVLHTVFLRLTFDQSYIKILEISGDMERTRKNDRKLVTFDCELDLEPAWFSNKFYTTSY